MKLQVNISRIEEIVGDDADLKKTLIGMFLSTCDKTINALQGSLALDATAGNKIWADSCHELKGAAMNLGFEELGEYCKKAEKAEITIEQKKEAIEVFKSSKDSVKVLFDTL